jgi:hypothetical protein
LWSHKAMRWLAPIPMVFALGASFALRADPWYGFFFYAQLLAYAAAALALALPGFAARVSPARLAAFFLLVNVAALQALWLWLKGTRVEVWQPTQRPK